MILKKKFYPLKTGYVLHLITAKDKKGIYYFIGVFDSEHPEKPIEKFYYRNTNLANRKYKECREKYGRKKWVPIRLNPLPPQRIIYPNKINQLIWKEVLQKMVMKYGHMREKFLQECRPELYKTLVQQNALDSHLKEIQKQAEMRLEYLINRQKRLEGITEELKATDQLKWVGMMNNIKASAEEIIMEELIYN